MKTKNILISAFAIVLILPLFCPAQITSFHNNGELTWSNSVSNAMYKVEWCSNLETGEWRSSWSELVDIVPTGGMVKATVPMFYRVVAEPLDSDMLAIEGGTFTMGDTFVGYFFFYHDPNRIDWFNSEINIDGVR